MTKQNTEARAYELMLVLKADQNDDAITKHIDSIKRFIVEQGGEIFFEDVWGRRDLAYTIRKEDVGYYIVMNFRVEPKNMHEITNHLRIDQMILRDLLIQTPAGYAPTVTTEKDLQWVKEVEEKEEEEKEIKPERKPRKEVKKEVEEKPEEIVEAVKEETEEPKVEEKEEVIVEEPTAEEEVVEETVEEKEEEKERPKPKKKVDEKKTIDDLDEKLKAIMNDTDIDISL